MPGPSTRPEPAARAARRATALLLAVAQLCWLAASGPASALSPPSPAGSASQPASPPPAPEPPRAMPAAQGRALVCESDGSYRRCLADTSAGVRLVREISKGRCAERSTWGFDAQAVWVDRGCRAEFQVALGAAPAPVPGGAPSPQAAPAGSETAGGGVGAGTILAILGAVVAGGAAAALLSGDEDEKSRKQKAVALCDQRLDRAVKDRGGKSGKILRIERARQRGNELELEAVAKAEWRRGADSRGRIDCLVDFKGKNEVLAFRQFGLWGGSGWGGSGGSWGGSGWGGSGSSFDDDRGQNRDRAVTACLRAAEARGLSRVRAVDADKTGRLWRVAIEARAGRRAARALCEYDQGRKRAAITALDHRG